MELVTPVQGCERTILPLREENQGKEIIMALTKVE